MNSLYIVERNPTDALKHYLKQYGLDLPQGYAEDALSLLLDAIMEIEVSQVIDASRYERNGSRRAYRNGYRQSAWLTSQRSIPIRIPKLRSGTYYPSFLDNEHAEQHFMQLIFDAYVQSVDFELIETMLNTLNVEAKASQIATIVEDLYDLVQNYRERLILPQRVQLDVLPVDDDGRERYLALAFDDSELLEHEITSDADEEFWQDFVRRLDGRSIHGVEYVAVSRVRTVVRLTKTNSPNMALAA